MFTFAIIMRTIVYIDPQSYKNLAIYDYCLLTSLPTEDGQVVFFGSSSYDYRPLPEGIRFVKLFSYNKKSNAVAKALSYAWSLVRLAVAIISQRPETVHIQWFKLPQLDHLLLRVLRCCSDAKIVHTAHNLLPHDTGDRYKDIYRKLYHAVDHIIVHTKRTKEQLTQMFGIDADKVSVIPHGILRLNIDEGQLAKHSAAYEDHYQTEGRLVFTSLGEQSRYKGTDLLAEAWLSTPQLRDNPQLRLIVVGNNDGDVDLTALHKCSNTVVENRRIPDDEFVYILQHTDVYLLPYRQISQSGALLTALAHHVPILVSNVGALDEPLRTANVGWNISQPTVDTLRQQLLHIATHPDLPRQIKADQKGWQRVCAQYDWHNIGILTAQAYRQATTAARHLL